MSRVESGVSLCNRYQVVSYIGGGGMAEVYRVRDLQRNADLAVKALKPELAKNYAFVQHFRDEADTLKDLEHPHIVRFYSFEYDKNLDVFFIVMDYVEGVTLREEMKAQGGRLAFQRILEIMRSLCSALDYAHKNGYIHRDIKPSNVLIGAGKVFVTDFGIAGASGGSLAGLEKIGTPGYMSPEQIRGETTAPVSDIYSLGVMLFEMTTGARPFRGDSPNAIGSTSERIKQEHLQLPPPSPRLYNPQVPPRLEWVILRCLEKAPAARFSSVGKLMRALEEAIPARRASHPTAARSALRPFRDPAQTPKTFAVSSRSKKRLATAVWAVLSIAILAAVFLLAALDNGGAMPVKTPVIKTSPLALTLPAKMSAPAPTSPASFSIRPFIEGVDDESQCAWCYLFTAKEPGRYYGTVHVPFGSPLVLKVEWCASSSELLADNWSSMAYSLMIDGYAVKRSQLTVLRKNAGAVYCMAHAGILENLSRGAHVYKDVRRFSERIFDGFDFYDRGDYIFEFAVNAH